MLKKIKTTHQIYVEEKLKQHMKYSVLHVYYFINKAFVLPWNMYP